MHPRPRETKLAAKKGRILNEVFRRERCSRFDLARRLNVNAAMVGTYVDEFLREGLLVEREPVQSRPGRAPVPLQLNPQHGCFLGLDFEALRARAVLCDFAGETLRREEIKIRSGATREDVLRVIVSLAKRLADRADRPLLMVGVAAPGQVDCLAGRILHYRLLRDFDQVPVREQFAAVFDVPIFVEDNIRAVAFGELMRGSGRGSHNFLCLAVRSGVGLGIVIDGKLYRGAKAMAGEAGYMVVSTREGPRLITDLVSATGFVQEIRALLGSWQSTTRRKQLVEKGDDLSLTDIVAVAESGDRLLHERLEMLGTHLGMLAANLANLFAPERIVLTGEVLTCSMLIRQSMERTFREFTLPQLLKTVYLSDGTLGGFAGALGVAWLGFTKVFPEEEAVFSTRIPA
ncbi:MAG: ROK family protein [Luteitalea sp.]|nr:ROK family protein [Luteitalea sp.]